MLRMVSMQEKNVSTISGSKNVPEQALNSSRTCAFVPSLFVRPA